MAQMDQTNNDAESNDHNQSGMDPRRVDDVVSHNATIGNVVVDTVVDAKNDDSCTRTISDTKKRKSDLTMEDDTTNNLNQQQLKQPKVVVANHRIQEQPALIATATNNNNTDNGNIINHPICIPITPPTTSNTTHDKIPEWAMIELNGELIKPSNGDHRNNDENSSQMVTSLVDSNSYELGTIQFMNPKVCFCVFLSLYACAKKGENTTNSVETTKQHVYVYKRKSS